MRFHYLNLRYVGDGVLSPGLVLAGCLFFGAGCSRDLAESAPRAAEPVEVPSTSGSAGTLRTLWTEHAEAIRVQTGEITFIRVEKIDALFPMRGLR